jgi:hypothetical protein
MASHLMSSVKLDFDLREGLAHLVWNIRDEVRGPSPIVSLTGAYFPQWSPVLAALGVLDR